MLQHNKFEKEYQKLLNSKENAVRENSIVQSHLK